MGAPTCCVEGCSGSKESKHRFPNPKKNLALFEKWLVLCGNKRLLGLLSPENIYANRRVCKLHFKTEDFGPNNTLLRTACPSQNLPNKEIINKFCTKIHAIYKASTSRLNAAMIETKENMLESPLKINLESDLQIQEHSKMEEKLARTAALKSFQRTFCRTCLRKISEGDAVSLFSTQSFYNGQALYELFKEITPTLMEQNDALPNSICSNCARRAKQSVGFKRCIENAHKTLIYTIRKAETTYDMALVQKLPSNFKDVLNKFSNEMSKIEDDAEGGMQDCGDTKPNSTNSTNMNKVSWKTNIVNIIAGRVTNTVPLTTITKNKPNILRAKNGIKSQQAILNGKQLPEKQRPANITQADLKIGSSMIMIDDEAADVIKIKDDPNDDVVTEKGVAEQLHILNVTNTLDKQYCNPEKEVANVKIECGDLALPLDFVPDDDKRIACYKCDKKFTSISILQRHLLYHSLDILQFETDKRENQTQGATATISATNNTMPTTSPGTFTKPCEFCEKEIPVGTMRKHICLNHEAEFQRRRRLRFTCSKCGQQYSSSSRLERHIKARHDGKFKCDRCDKRFLLKRLLDQHLHHTHGVKATTVCYICGKTISKASIHVHIRTHVLTKSIKCTVEGCHALLKYKSSLRDHLASVHGTELTHMCEFCGRAFPAKVALRTHLRSHSKNLQYMCEMCERRFITPGELKTHTQRLHQQVKAYNCPVCPQVFAYNYSIKKHCGRYHPEHPLALKKTNRPYRNYSIHPALEKTFTCIVCSRMFACDYNLKKHITRFHPVFLFSQKQVQLDEAASTIPKSPGNV